MDKYTHDRDDPRIAEEQAARAERCAAAAAVADIFFFLLFCLCVRLQNFNFFVTMMMPLFVFFRDRTSHPTMKKHEKPQKKSTILRKFSTLTKTHTHTHTHKKKKIRAKKRYT
jgi:hypothetical protein